MSASPIQGQQVPPGGGGGPPPPGQGANNSQKHPSQLRAQPQQQQQQPQQQQPHANQLTPYQLSLMRQQQQQAQQQAGQQQQQHVPPGGSHPMQGSPVGGGMGHHPPQTPLGPPGSAGVTPNIPQQHQPQTQQTQLTPQQQQLQAQYVAQQRQQHQAALQQHPQYAQMSAVQQQQFLQHQRQLQQQHQLQQHQQHPPTQQQQHIPQQLQMAAAAEGLYRKPQSHGAAIVRLLQFAEVVGNAGEQGLDVEYWRRMSSEFFSENGLLKFSVHNMKEGKQFEIPLPIISRLYYTFFQSGVKHIQYHLENPREYPTMTNGYFVDCSRSNIQFTFHDGTVVHVNAPIRVIFSQTMKIEWMEQHLQGHMEYINRAALPNRIQRNDNNEDGSGNFFRLHPSGITPFGVTGSVMRFLEIAETIAHMRDLIVYSYSATSGGPLKSLEMLAKAHREREIKTQQQPQPQPQQPPQPQQQPQQQSQAAAKNGPASSPMMANNTGYPNSNGNTKNNQSPRLNNKRRRPSTKDDLEGSDGNASANQKNAKFKKQ